MKKILLILCLIVTIWIHNDTDQKLVCLFAAMDLKVEGYSFPVVCNVFVGEMEPGEKHKIGYQYDAGVFRVKWLPLGGSDLPESYENEYRFKITPGARTIIANHQGATQEL